MTATNVFILCHHKFCKIRAGVLDIKQYKLLHENTYHEVRFFLSEIEVRGYSLHDHLLMEKL